MTAGHSNPRHRPPDDRSAPEVPFVPTYNLIFVALPGKWRSGWQWVARGDRMSARQCGRQVDDAHRIVALLLQSGRRAVAEVDIDGLLPQRADRRLLLRYVRERVEEEQSEGVVMGHLRHLVIWNAVEVDTERLGRQRPR